jgi:NAD+ kinase
MRLKKVVVVYKKTALQLYARERQNRRVIELLRSEHPVTRRFVPSHESHSDSLRFVRETFRRRGIAAEFVYRAKSFRERGVDLVLTVGGDGTFLDASHSVVHAPMLGLNSSPEDSVGLFCGISAARFEETLDAILEDRTAELELTRLRIAIGGRVIPFPVLNDALVAHSNPAATSKMILRRGIASEDLKCSGVWIAPAAGTTAAVASAGGKVMPIRSRGFQFVVREPYSSNGRSLRLAKGVVPAGDRLTVVSKMRTGRVYIDGAHSWFPIPFGERLTVDTRTPSLRLFGFDEARRRRLFG